MDLAAEASADSEIRTTVALAAGASLLLLVLLRLIPVAGGSVLDLAPLVRIGFTPDVEATVAAVTAMPPLRTLLGAM